MRLLAMPRLSLDCLTLTDTAPEDLIRSAFNAGFDLVSLWAHSPGIYPKQQLTQASAIRCAALLADTGVTVHAIEAVDIASSEAVLAARPAIDLGAMVGAKAVVAYHHVNPDRMQAADALARLAEEAEQRGMEVVLEPVAMGHTRTPAAARDLIRDAGVDAGILFDTYHFTRAGGTLADIAGVEPSLIRRVQINDGLVHVPESEWLSETVGERLYPGQGEFPLVDLLRALPADVPWAIESPSLRRMRAGISPEAQAAEAFAALQNLLRQLRST